MNTLREMLPKEALNVIDMVHEQGCKLYQQATEHYMVLNNHMKKFVEDSLPEHLHPLSMKVIDSLPETLFSLSVITDIGRSPFAIGFWAIRAIQTLSPLVQPVFSGQIDKDTLDAVGREAWGKVSETVERFKPAILVSCGVAAVFQTVIGVLSLNIDSVFQGSVFALAATMAYQSMDLTQKEAASSSNASDSLRARSRSGDSSKVD